MREAHMFEIAFVVLIILILDGLVSATEAAFFSTPISRARMLSETSWRAKVLLSLKEKSEGPITTLISLSNIITIVGSVLVGAIVGRAVGSQWLGVVSAILTFLIMVFAEIIPKKIGERFAENVSLATAPALRAISFTFTPIVWFVNRIVGLFAYGTRSSTTSEEEISFLAKIGSKEGAIEERESQLIQRIFRLNDITAKDMMTPRHVVEFIDGNQALKTAREEILFARHSRLPVFDGTRDNIIGITHQRELLRALVEGNYNGFVRDFMHKTFYVPENRLADDLLRDFQQHKTHLGVVVDEHGSIIGVVGLEDILEELVGEIIDEREVAPETIKRISKNEIAVHGQTKIDTLNQFFNTDIKSRKTVNGFLIGKLRKIPAEGESIKVNGLLFIIEKASERAVEKVRVVKDVGQ